MDTKGGRVSITINGVTYSARAEVKLMLSGVAVQSGVNRDGTGYKTVEPKLVGFEATFDRGLFLWDETMMLQNVDATVSEPDVGKTHMFSSGNFDGEPVIDTATGAASGIKVMTAGANYSSF